MSGYEDHGWEERHEDEMVLVRYPHRLLRPRAMEAIAAQWTDQMCELATKLAKLPSQMGWDEDPLLPYGFFFAIDTMLDKPASIRALLRIADDLEERPTYLQMFEMARTARAMRKEVGLLLKKRTEAKTPPRCVSRRTTSGPIGFRRGD
jgi:hypothetical protein